MNNKGQTLVLFIILLPVILILSALIINLGSTSIQKRKLDIIVKNIVEDNMDNLNDTNITEQIDLMLKNNIDKYFVGEKLVNVEGLILEMSFTYLYFNKDNSFRLSNYVNKNYLEETFKLTLDGTQINNIVNTIKIGV